MDEQITREKMWNGKRCFELLELNIVKRRREKIIFSKVTVERLRAFCVKKKTMENNNVKILFHLP